MKPSWGLWEEPRLWLLGWWSRLPWAAAHSPSLLPWGYYPGIVSRQRRDMVWLVEVIYTRGSVVKSLALFRSLLLLQLPNKTR